MSIDLARKVAGALDVRSETKIRAIDQALSAYARLTTPSPVVPITGTIDTSQVVSGTFDDARIAESNVTQHEAAIDHDALANFVAAEHIDWSVTGAEDVHVDRIAEGAVTQHEAALSIDAGTQLVNTLADARVAESNVTQHEAALDIDYSQLDNVPSTFTPADHLSTGTWTPADASGAGLTLTGITARYTKHEKGLIVAHGRFTYPATADVSNNLLSGLTHQAENSLRALAGFVALSNYGSALYVTPLANTTTFRFADLSGTVLTNAQLSGKTFNIALLYVEA